MFDEEEKKKKKREKKPQRMKWKAGWSVTVNLHKAKLNGEIILQRQNSISAAALCN